MKPKLKETETGRESAPEIYPVELIAVTAIDPSPANKRRIYDHDKSLRELGESIEAQGLLQAVVVRKHPEKKKRYELVAGERRWRAFRLKGWKEIPAVVRKLTDKEAHDITASENLHREDLSPLEEAESIQVLLDDGREAREIADRIGKPLSWVVRRARIAGLTKKWLNAIADQCHPLSKWSATHLELIARYDHKKQDELFEDYGNKYRTNHAVLTVKELEMSLNELMFSLSGAPWKKNDETLLSSAGACTLCEKRTSCSPSLFEPIDDVKSSRSDRCLDRECWGRKLVAYHEIRIKKASEEHGNLVLIDNDGSVLPPDHPWKKSLSDSYKYEQAKKGDEKALPVYIVDGPGAGKIRHMKLQSWYEKLEKKRPVGKDGKPVPKSIEEKKEGLEKRRVVRFINKLMLILKGENQNDTATKRGVCRVCGCTEDNCTQCVEKTGSRCHWVNDMRTLCSACADSVEKNDGRESIADELSHIEAHALIAAFGATPARIEGEGDDKYMYDFDRWKVFEKVVVMNGGEAIRSSVYGAFDRIVDRLRETAGSPDPDVAFTDNLCNALRINREDIWSKVIEEIPEPASWAKPKKDDTLKPKKAGKIKACKKVSDLVDDKDSGELPAKRYEYRGREIFVTHGLNENQFGTFFANDKETSLHRVKSKIMPMVSDKNEAQRNLDLFAKDKQLSEVA
ncbi:MAG: ParB/RepB/Spo0J family partition protein [Deltaproteobacteria bacterium]|nr:ParB/RepB/Spo0J family partition protein [Deltaproteobacteria bacterium]